MADAITIKALQDASLDAKSLEEVVNGNEVKQVTTRKGETYPSVKKAIKTLFENGGLPATPFATKALMTASALIDGDYAMVTADTDINNNGLYVKEADTWKESGYDPYNAIKNLKKDNVDTVNRLTSVGRNLKDLHRYVGGYIHGVQNYDNPLGLQSYKIEVSAGSTLSFEYMPNANTQHLSQERTVTGEGIYYWPKLYSMTKKDSKESFSITTPIDAVYVVTDIDIDTLRVDGVEASTESLGEWATILHCEYKQAIALANFRVLAPVSVKKGDVVTITNPAKGSACIALDGSRQALYYLDTDTPEEYRLGLEWVAPDDMTIRLIGYADSEFFIDPAGAPSSQDATIGDIVRFINKTEGVSGTDMRIPDMLQLPERETVFATGFNYILKTEVIEGVEYIASSSDLGESWVYAENIIGDIVHTHIFTDGTVMLCGPDKVYWSYDFTSWNESVIYDVDGEVFIPNGKHFYQTDIDNTPCYIDGQEVYVFGDYTVDPAVKSRVWVTKDRGKTITALAKFGTTEMAGAVRNVRHLHRVAYNKYDEYFYVPTGDNGSENMLLRFKYNLPTDDLAWELLGQGDEYKFSGIFFDEIFTYMFTDYTSPALADKKGIIRVPTSDIGNPDKYVRIYKADPAEWGSVALTRMLMDNNGNALMQGDYLGIGVVWLAIDGLDFKKVPLSNPNLFLKFSTGVNYKGDVYCIEFKSVADFNRPRELKFNRGSYNVTKMLREAGITNWMRGMTLRDRVYTTTR